MSIGIDYGWGSVNIDHKTGIHYGVISQHSIDPQALWDDVEYDYGKPTCPNCGDDIRESTADEDKDFYCEKCDTAQWSDSVYSNEPLGWSFEESEYSLGPCHDSDIFVFRSPYYTFAQFCSPCVPGAGDLDGYDKDGVKTYCLGHDFFEDNKAPYPVYNVSDDKEVKPLR